MRLKNLTSVVNLSPKRMADANVNVWHNVIKSQKRKRKPSLGDKEKFSLMKHVLRSTQVAFLLPTEQPRFESLLCQDFFLFIA